MRNLNKSLLLILLSLSLPLGALLAQEAEGEEDGALFHYSVALEMWVSQPVGLNYSPSSMFASTNPFGELVLRPQHSTTDEFRYSGGLHFRRNNGSVIFSYYEHHDENVGLAAADPGNYIFTTGLASPINSGLNNDGLADGFDSSFRTVLRDTRIAYKRKAFESNRLRGDWWVGLRRIAHKRQTSAEYFSIVDGLPPLIPPLVSNPRQDLDPLPDTADIKSDYRGRGLEVGMAFETSFLKDKKLKLRASVGLAFLRGKVRSEYQSLVHAYQFQDPLTGIQSILQSPYDLFGEIIQIANNGATGPAVNFIEQLTFADRFLDGNRSMSSSVLDTEISFDYRVQKFIELFFGFRGSVYDNVGTESRREVTAFGSQVVNQIAIDAQSATYEGFFGGVRFHY